MGLLALLALAVGFYSASAATSSDREFPDGIVGHWTFDSPDSLTQATIGNDLVLEGSHTPIEGPTPEDGAVNIGIGSFYRCFHDIPANGGEGAEWVNCFTIIMDVRIPQLSQWYCFYQTNWNNSNDGDWFINPSGQVGVGETGYSSYVMVPEEWYRLAISVHLGEHYDYYLDGQLLHNGGAQVFEGRFALYPAGDANQVLFFADENGEDGPIDVAMIALFDRDLSAEELADLGGYGHEIEGPGSGDWLTYLQTPTPTSIYACWHSSMAGEPIVEYGLTDTLGQNVSASTITFDSSTVWHWAQLTGLEPKTTYYYRCVIDTAASPIRAFHTQPADDDTSTHVRFAVYGDTRTDSAMHTQVVEAIRDKVQELYGEDLHEHLNVVLNVGDIVTTGSVLSQYQDEYFTPIESLSGAVPFMVSIGNHEGESPYYYQYMKYEDVGGDEGELYYSFRIGPIFFVALNSNTQGATQLSWLEDQLTAAEADEGIDWVFIFLHHPGRSEIWPDGNTAWVQDDVIPTVAQYTKAEALMYGHSHNYERGAWKEGNLRLLLSGGGGSALDRWGMYGNQEDYREIHRAHDHYNYTIFDVDCANGSYTAETYTLGHTDLPLSNELLESFSRVHGAAPPQQPAALAPSGQWPLPVTLCPSPFTGEMPVMTSRFQVTDTEGDWSAPIVDVPRDWENIYGDTGPPDYEPIDLNAGIDLTRAEVPEGSLQLGQTYWWRVCYRDQNLQWSEWSADGVFTVADIPPAVDFTADITAGEAPLAVRFTDLSSGTPLAWSWDLDGDEQIDSQDRDPVWTYEEEGTYTVSLTADHGGDPSTETKAGYIVVTGSSDAGAVITFPPHQLAQNRPNPFNPRTTIEYSLRCDSDVVLEIYDVRGRLIRRFVEGRQSPGTHAVIWDGRDAWGQAVGSGVYNYQLRSGEGRLTRQAVYLR